jgi:hypothetical protein
MISSTVVEPETTELARVLCVAMIEPLFGKALLDNPIGAIKSHPRHQFKLTEIEQQLLVQPDVYTLEELAARIERQRQR